MLWQLATTHASPNFSLEDREVSKFLIKIGLKVNETGITVWGNIGNK
jgi:hypothetical protein